MQYKKFVCIKTFIFRKYSKERMKPIVCPFMKQNYHFDRGPAQHKHATPPLSLSGTTTTLLGPPKRYITLVHLKGLKSYQPSKFKRVDFLSFYLVKWTFRPQASPPHSR